MYNRKEEFFVLDLDQFWLLSFNVPIIINFQDTKTHKSMQH